MKRGRIARADDSLKSRMAEETCGRCWARSRSLKCPSTSRGLGEREDLVSFRERFLQQNVDVFERESKAEDSLSFLLYASASPFCALTGWKNRSCLYLFLFSQMFPSRRNPNHLSESLGSLGRGRSGFLKSKAEGWILDEWHRRNNFFRYIRKKRRTRKNMGPFQ